MINRYKDSPSFASDTSLMPPIPRIAAIHDLSCLGRCALTVIIPILSAMGLQTIPLPTALLSTHTGGFEGMYFKDLTHAMTQIPKHWTRIGVNFDAIYSGFLGSAEQIDAVLGFISRFRKGNEEKNALITVDPVMGDDGVLYSTYNTELVRGVRRLCYGADVITPNITEACFLTDTPYPDSKVLGQMTEHDANGFAERLAQALESSFGCKKIVITGIVSGNNVTTAAFDSDGKTVKSQHFYTAPLLPRAYPGTGDAFASVLLGKLLKGEDFFDAARSASDFVRYAIEISQGYKTPIRDGLIIEPCLHKLI